MEKQLIYHKNCLDGMQAIASKSVKLIIADPPYFQGLTHNGKKAVFEDLNISTPFFRELFKEFKRILTDDGEVFFFCDFRGYAYYYPIAQEYLNVRNMIVWDKISGAGNLYAFTHELIIYASEKSNVRKKGQNIWRIKAFCSGAKSIEGKKLHPTQKVQEIISKMIIDCSKEGDLVVDPFSGSGTTAVCCKKLNRNFIGFEIVEKYYNIAQKRLKAA